MKTPPARLFIGEDAFLLREEALSALGDAQPVEVDADEWEGGETGDLATPSLFGERRALLVTGCRSIRKDALAELTDYLASPTPDALLVLTGIGSKRDMTAALKKLDAAVTEAGGTVGWVEVSRKDAPGWVLQRARGKGIELAPDAARALLDTVADFGAIDKALDQLASAFPEMRITASEVDSQFRGLGEQKVWDLCDKAFSKDLAGAMRSLRSLMDAREEGLMMLGFIAGRVRELMRIRALPDRLSDDQVAKQAGLRFGWQARNYRAQARRFSREELERIHDRIVETDRAIKLSAPEDVVLPLLVVSIAGEGRG